MTTREGSRFRVGLPAIFHTSAGDETCTAHDLSRTGVRVEGALRPPEASSAIVTITGVGGDLKLRIKVRVARIDACEGDGQLRLGLEFGELSDNQRQTLEALIARAMEGGAPAPLEELTETSKPEEIRAALERIQLPHRIALAQRAQPREREILRHDPQSQVLEALARNPNLSGREVRALLRNVQLPTSVLEVLAKEPRWKADPDVLIQVATHPRVSVTLAQRILDGLPLDAKRKALQRPGLPDVLRSKLLSEPRRR
ncbi:MAG TPA: PilZ domain-containing protein [Candidatus Polarisedimenticolaceae bacterium]|nr:PilZ domain-containing protein [Candidatus Polarisedimenticolaceae bacterium]